MPGAPRIDTSMFIYYRRFATPLAACVNMHSAGALASLVGLRS